MSATKTAPSIAPPIPATITEGTPAKPDKERRECHTIQNDTHFVCGMKRWDSGGSAGGGGSSGVHSRAECIAQNHLHCQSCLAMEDLGLDGRRC